MGMTTRHTMFDECAERDARETVVLVDRDDRALGACGKLEAHRTGRLHRAVSVLVFDDAGRLLLQRRAASKYHFAGRWSNSCCGHPRPGEPAHAAATRRLREELGLTIALVEIAGLRYRAVDPETGLIEHEIVHVYSGRCACAPRPAPEEVGAYCWMSPQRVVRSVARRPAIFTPWFGILAKALLSERGHDATHRRVAALERA